MKKIIFLFSLLLCLSNFGATVNVVFTLTDFQLSATSNQTVWIQAMSVPTVNNSSIVIGPKLITNSGTGTFTVAMSTNLLYACTVKDPLFGNTIGAFSIFPTNATGPVSAYLCLVASSTATFPAGSVAWAAASSDLRYAPIGLALTNGVLLNGTNVFTGTNTFTNDVCFSNGITFGGVRLTNWPGSALPQTVISNLNGQTNGTQTFATATSGSDFAISSSVGTHTFSLPAASASTTGKLTSADWTTFNGKQAALGFTPVPNTRQVATSSPLTGGGALSGDLTLAIPKSTGAVDGYLAAADFVTFSNKISSSVTINVQSPLTGGGPITNLTTIALPAATSTQSGYLTNVDWVTFNAKQQAITASAPLSLVGGSLTIQQADATHSGYVSSTDFNTFNGKQAGSTALSNFASLGTNYYQATNANLTQWQQQPTNAFVPATNGTASNLSIVGGLQYNQSATTGYVLTASNSSGVAYWQPASGGGGFGIATLNGFGTNTTLTNASLTNAVAGPVFTVIAQNQAALTGGLVLSNSTVAHHTPDTNQPSPPIIMVGSALNGDTPQTQTLVLQNNSTNVDGSPTSQLTALDVQNGTLFTWDVIQGLVIPGNVGSSGAAITLVSDSINFANFATGFRQIPQLDENGTLQQGATTDYLPQGLTNKWYSNSLVQAFGDIRYQRKGIKTISTTYTATTNDYTLICDTTSGGFTVSLPLADNSTNLWVFKNLTTNALIIAAGGSDRIEGAFFFTNTVANRSDVFQSDGSANYRELAYYIPANGNGIATFSGIGTNTTIDSLTVNTNLTLNGSETIASNLYVTGFHTNLTNVVIGGTLTVTNLSTFGSNQAQITKTGHFISNPGQASIAANFVAGNELNTNGAGAANTAIVGGAANNAGNTGTVANSGILAGISSSIIGPGTVGSASIISGSSNQIRSVAVSTGVSNSVIIGGVSNTISGDAASTGYQGAVIIGGISNVVNKSHSVAIGQNNVVTNANTFSWNNNPTNFVSQVDGSFLINSTNGVGINTNNPGTNALNVHGGVKAYSFAGDGSQLTGLSGTTNANTAKALYYPSVSALPLVYTNTGGQPDALFLPLSIAQQGGSGDYSIPIIIPSPLASTCGGFFFPMFTTNAGTGRSVWSILANGQTNYLHDLKAGQIGAVPENSSDIGQGTIGMFDDPNYPFAFGGFINGFENHWLYQDPTNALLQFPLASTVAGRDARVAPSVMVIDQKNNFVVVTNQIKLGTNLYIGYGVSTISGGAGIPIFTNAGGGVIPYIDPTTISPLGALSVTNLTINAPNLVNAISFGGATYMQRTGGGGDMSFFDNSGEYLRIGGAGGDNFLSMRTTGAIGWNTDGAGSIGSSAGTGIGRPSQVFAKSNIVSGLAAGFVTINTNQYAVSATGWTNTNSFNCTLYITSATAATFTYNDGTNNIFTDTGLTFTTSESFGMGPSYKVTVASGTITGVAIASH